MAVKPQANVKRPPLRPSAGLAAEPRTSGLVTFLERHSVILAIALVLFASARIVATYPVFSHTSDEPAHIACGIEWLDKGAYTWEPQHPPLARVALALGPYLAGARSQNTPRVDIYSMTQEGISILFNGNRYDRTLALARLGVLPFFWVACLVAYGWGKRYFGRAVAVIALFLFSFLPPVLAHAGLATTDMALTAFLSAAFLTGAIWIERPTLTNGALFGASTALAVLSKFSTLAYFPAAAAVALVWFYFSARPRPAELIAAARQRVPSLGLAVTIACLMIWAMYRFSFGATDFGRLPAPELFAGIKQVMQHNSEGHPGFILGQRIHDGVWYFFPVALAVKTPIGFLVLLGYGTLRALRRDPKLRHAWLPLAFSAGILGVALFSHIDIGVRHVLPAYLGFALLAGIGAARWLEMAALGSRKWANAVLATLLVWFSGASLLSHPDYLPYFNELAGSHPENILVDSDLDWGQDMKRLAARLNQAGAQRLFMIPFLSDLPDRAFGLPPIVSRIDALNPMPGWNAVNLTVLKRNRLGLQDSHPEYSPWPDRVAAPGERIGKGILLWYFPPG